MFKAIFLIILSISFAQTYIKGPGLVEGVASTATAAGTTTLTKDSQTNQTFTGSTTQTVVLPNATTLPVGRRFYITNRSTGSVTVNFNGGSLARTLIAGDQATFIVKTNGTSAGTWDISTIPSVSLTSAVSGVLPIANGGTNNGSLGVTAGGILYSDGTKLMNTGAGTSGFVLQSNGASAPSWVSILTNPSGTDQQVLKRISGAPSWEWPLSQISAATTTYSIAATDNVVTVDSTSASFTVTLPTAASVAGKTIIIKKLNSTLNPVTVATTSSQTIDGSTSIQLWTLNEFVAVTSNGSNWIITNKFNSTKWASYTPSTQGFGTLAASFFEWRRSGQNIFIRGKMVIGTPTAVEMRIGLPSGLTSLTTFPAGATTYAGGRVAQNLANLGAGGGTSLIDPNFTYFRVGMSDGGSATTLAPGNGNSIFNPGATIAFENIVVPIEGWSE